MPLRPKYLNLLQIRMPLPAIVSIMHRVSGAALFLALPLMLWWWQTSLTSINTFAVFRGMVSLWWMKVIMIGLVWGYLHHLFAGLRHVVMDLDMATDLPAARLSSVVVLVVSIALTVLIGVRLW